jgi:MoaA/NifB/PqqE/SkfB family radical SAM enzyme
MNIISGIHVEITNICTLKCPGCPRTQFIGQFPSKWKNSSLDQTDLLNFLDIDLSGKTITFCGNYGDPIYHSDLFSIIDSFHKKGANVEIVTNGSYKSATWWKELSGLLGENDSITFSVDGLENTNKIYRVNSDWKSIQLGIKTVVKNTTAKVSWKFIPFIHNEDQIYKAEYLSKELGINFELTPSDRWDKFTNHLKPLNFKGAREELRKKENGVSAKCASGAQHFISAEGYYSPCCFVGTHQFYYKTEFGKNKKAYNIKDHTLTEILRKPTVIEFYNSITTGPLPVCQFNCPAE